VSAKRRPDGILVLHASVGAGHKRAAEAVAKALALEAPDARVAVVDAMDLARPAFKKVYGSGYLRLVEKAPALFGLLFEMTDRPARDGAFGERLRRAVQRWGAAELVRLLEGGGWDAIVHTHFLAPELACALRRAGRLDAPQLAAVTDLDAHRLWAQPGIDRFCVAGPLAAASLRRHGVPAGDIHETGIPVDPAFSVPADREDARRAFGLSGDRPVVVQASGGHGVGPVESVLRGLLAASVPAEFVVVCGRNEEAKRRLKRLRAPSRHRVKVLGYTDRMRELMAAADLLVTKPGGLTVSEALSCGLPMALIRPIPGQEERNAVSLAEAGAAARAESPAALAGLVEGILGAPGRLAEMRRRARALGRPRAAFAVAREALKLAALSRRGAGRAACTASPSARRRSGAAGRS
jgi:processive 1,2-diacylglycerol beta-glucosyltransferase